MWTNRIVFTHIPTEDIVRQAEKLAQQMNGLPGISWLEKNGHYVIAKRLRTDASSFDHIERKVKGERFDLLVKIAERLAEENGGLRSIKWLRQNKYNNIALAMRKHPKMFAHIPRLLLRRDFETAPKFSYISPEGIQPRYEFLDGPSTLSVMSGT